MRFIQTRELGFRNLETLTDLYLLENKDIESDLFRYCVCACFSDCPSYIAIISKYYSSEEEAKQKLYDIVEKVCGDDKILLYGEY